MASARAVVFWALASATAVAQEHTRYLLDRTWKFSLLGASPGPCANPSDFNISFANQQCINLQQAAYANDEAACLAACCADTSCDIYQWCPDGASCSPSPSCWIGQAAGGCNKPVANSWHSKGRTPLPPPPLAPALGAARTQTATPPRMILPGGPSTFLTTL